jgi:BirA family biotin operon repressor/biotin-[acetyl-CoA-carboxylase] ligase
MLILECVDSTNNYATALVQRGELGSGNAIFALQQTAGKGRRGRQWESSKGANILLSIPVEMQWLSVSHQFELSVAVALACLDLLSEHVLANLFIKWPNDIFLNDKKTAGILIDNVLRGNSWQWAIIGIGININQENFEGLGFAATSLSKETNRRYNVVDLAEQLHQLVLKRISDLKKGDFSRMLNDYNSHLYGKGKKVKLKKQNIVFQAEITGVSSSGQLIIKDGMERRFDFDEVEFKGIVD